MNIYSLVENEIIIEVLDSVLENTKYRIEWLAHEAKLYEKLRIYDEAIVFLPKSYVYNLYKVGAFLTQQLPKVKVVLVLGSEDDFDSRQAGNQGVLYMNSPSFREHVLSIIEYQIDKTHSKLIITQR
ncbi:hypothetical protein [Fredinandcohnia sp. 179-A 10B2 NHS]|uniref:hypothetical protein n=1 Tax=Fredinandcohnia sp. 179-A 10B2 NHS TaxID=3235176 RepID=UPI0039A28CE8